MTDLDSQSFKPDISLQLCFKLTGHTLSDIQVIDDLLDRLDSSIGLKAVCLVHAEMLTTSAQAYLLEWMRTHKNISLTLLDTDMSRILPPLRSLLKVDMSTRDKENNYAYPNA